MVEAHVVLGHVPIPFDPWRRENAAAFRYSFEITPIWSLSIAQE
jgi:hypothetical protein